MALTPIWQAIGSYGNETTAQVSFSLPAGSTFSSSDILHIYFGGDHDASSETFTLYINGSSVINGAYGTSGTTSSMQKWGTMTVPSSAWGNNSFLWNIYTPSSVSAQTGTISAALPRADGFTQAVDGNGGSYGSYIGIGLFKNLNTSPNAPTGITVTNSPVPTGTSPIVTWTHNDPDGNPQAQYQIRWRKKD